MIRSFAMTVWYVVEAAYKSIMPTPNRMTAANAYPDGMIIETFTIITTRATTEKMAPAKWVNALTGSLT